MKPRKILAPHKEQDGWRYIRVPSSIVTKMGDQHDDAMRVFDAAIVITRGSFAATIDQPILELSYRDTEPWSRIISSRRVEEAVETADYLKKCAGEGLCALNILGTWYVSGSWSRGGYYVEKSHEAEYVNFVERDGKHAGGRTLREAYHRYHAAAGDAS